MTDQIILIADIGGTNARFALVGQGSGEFKRSEVLQCADYETVELAISAYLQMQNIEHPDVLCFAAAGPIIHNQTIRLTNNHWRIDMLKLEREFNVASTRLLNDFEAISHALLHLAADQVKPIGGSWDLPTGDNLNLGIIGPGSGLGVGGLIRRESADYSLVTEGGHAGFSPENPYQLEVLKFLFDKYKRVSNERLLSGPGLVNIYRAVCLIEGVAAGEIDAHEIGRLATAQTNPQCREALSLFFEILGQVAGDVALTQAAFDGVFIGGGISRRYPGELIGSQFRAAFEHKGRHSHLLESTPTWLITENNPGLIGASSYALKFLV